MLTGSQRIIERDVHDAVAIFNIEHNRVAAKFTPAANDAFKP